ncbi:hypothetical protein [Ensifer aridi]|uniref:hypothetical protein n=1 Tax=Ensifer aridi TaxID=1708715 RepID=UPI000A1177A1|nr:hypothetical protein [Ensifer aridi]
MRVAVLLLFGFVCILPGRADADSFQWSGRFSDVWEDPRNWGQSRYPGDGVDDDEASIEALGNRTAARVKLGRSVTLKKLDLGRGVRLFGGSITVTEDTTWSDGEVGTAIKIPNGARMSIEGSTEKRLSHQADRPSLLLIDNAGQLTIGGSGRLHLLFEARIGNTGRIVLRSGANVMGNRCCSGLSSGIVGPGEIAVEQGILPGIVTGADGADLSNLMLETDGPIRIAPNTVLFLSGGSHKLADGIQVGGGGRLLLRHAEADVRRIVLAAGTALEIADRSRLKGAVTLDGQGAYSWTGGEVTGSLEVSNGTALTISGGDAKEILNPSDTRRGQLRNLGNIRLTDSAHLKLGSGRSGGSRFENRGTLILNGDSKIVAGLCCNDPSILANSGRIEKGDGEVELRGVFLSNEATVELKGGRLLLSASAEFKQEEGEVIVGSQSALEAKRIELIGGVLSGGGSVRGMLDNVSGEVAPGPGDASLKVEGDFTQGYNGVLSLDVGGLAAGTESDFVEVTGTVMLDGERRVKAKAGFRPAVGKKVAVLQYLGRKGVFARTPGLDISSGLHLWAQYEEPAGSGATGTLALKAFPTNLPTYCLPPAAPLVWESVRSEVPIILGHSDAAEELLGRISGRWRVIRPELQSGALGLTGRDPRYPDNRGLFGMQYAWSRFKSVFQFATVFNHEAEHVQQAYARKYVATEAAPFMDFRQYATLFWSGEEAAYRAQSKGLFEIANTSTNFERCRADILTDDPVLERLAAGNDQDAREKIVEEHPLADVVTSWQKYRNIESEERTRLADVENRVQDLLASPGWQDLAERWDFALH